MYLINRYKTFFILSGLIILTFFFEIWKLGDYKLKEFDEGRFAVNAFEMMHNGDYINLHYMNEPDAWVARPPLKSWLIMAGYKILGFNVYGARLSSMLAIIGFIVYSFQLGRIFYGRRRSLFICLMLLACKGIIGFHIGRTADMDAELIFFLTAFIYHFSQYYFFQKKSQAIYWGIFLALSFFLKTTASLLFIPGILLFVIIERNLKSVISDKYFWYGASVYLITVISWFLIVHMWGATYVNTQYAGNNAWQTMLIYDTWMRFTASHFDGHPVESNYQFFIHVLDSRFNIWNYLAYAGIIWWLYDKIKHKPENADRNRFLLFCLCLIIPPAILLTFGMHKLDWYAAPTLLFMAIFASEFESKASNKWHYFRYIFIVILLFGLARQVLYISEQSQEKSIITFIESHKNYLDQKHILCLSNTPSNIYAWLCWQGYNVKVVANTENIKDNNTCVIGQATSDQLIGHEHTVVSSTVYDPYNAVIYIAELNR